MDAAKNAQTPGWPEASPVSRCREIRASLMYGVSLLERTLRIGLRSTSSSGAAAIIGEPGRVHRRPAGLRGREGGREAAAVPSAPPRKEGVCARVCVFV